MIPARHEEMRHTSGITASFEARQRRCLRPGSVTLKYASFRHQAQCAVTVPRNEKYGVR